MKLRERGKRRPAIPDSSNIPLFRFFSTFVSRPGDFRPWGYRRPRLREVGFFTGRRSLPESFFFLQKEDTFHRGIQLFGNANGKDQRRIGVVAFQAADGFPAHAAGVGKLLLGQAEAITVFFDFIFHEDLTCCDLYVILCENYITNYGKCKVFYEKILKFFVFCVMIYYVTTKVKEFLLKI